VTAGLAAFAATAALAVTRTRPEQPRLPLAPITTVGGLEHPLPAGTLGPEGIPIPKGAPLAPPRLLRNGENIDGIPCQMGEQIAFHIHAHLRIVVRGRSRQVPAGIGIAPPYEVEPTPAGAFVAGGTCFAWLHTHAADGIIHIESPVKRVYTLGQFFRIWGQPLDHDHVGPNRGAVTAFFDGRVFIGNPREIPLLPHSQIELELGRPLVAPDEVSFPSGL
jgi:hypothetical protein